MEANVTGLCPRLVNTGFAYEQKVYSWPLQCLCVAFHACCRRAGPLRQELLGWCNGTTIQMQSTFGLNPASSRDLVVVGAARASPSNGQRLREIGGAQRRCHPGFGIPFAVLQACDRGLTVAVSSLRRL